MSAQGIRAGRAYVELGTSDSRLVAGLKSAQAKLQAFGMGLTKVGGAIMGVGSAVLGPMLGATAVFASSGDELSKMSNKTGASVESLSELRHAAQQSAVDFKQLGGAMNKMQRNLGEAVEGDQTALDMFDRIGLSVSDLMGMAPDKQFELIADKLASIEDPAIRTQAAMDIFGRSGAELMPLMLSGAKGIQALRKEARDLGLQVSGKDAAAATLLGDTWANVQKTLKDVVFEVGAALAPALTDAMNVVIPLITSAAAWISNNRQLVVTIAAVAAGVIAGGAALVGLGTAALIASAAIGGMVAIGSTLLAVMGAIFSPIGILIVLLAALAVGFFTLTDSGQQTVSWFTSGFGQMLSTVKEVMGGIFNAIKGGRLDLAAQILWTSLKIVWQKGIGAILVKWETFKQSMISAFDGIIVGIRSVWNNVSTWLANKIIWLIEKINSLASSILGVTVIGQESIDSLRDGVRISNEEFQADIRRRKQERDLDRKQRIDEVRSNWSTDGLEKDLQNQLDEANSSARKSAVSGLAGSAASAAASSGTAGHKFDPREIDPAEFTVPSIEIDVDDLTQQIQLGTADAAENTKMSGTFSAAQASQFIGRTDKEQKQIDLLTEIARFTRDMSLKRGLIATV